MLKPEPITTFKFQHGEGPVWCTETQTLYSVDILKGDYYKYNFLTDKVSSFNVGQPLGVLALTNTNELVMGLRDGIGFWNEDKQQLSIPPELKLHTSNSDLRFNDGAIDPAGRFLAGTMTFKGDKPLGKLYQLDKNKKLSVLKESMYIPNGMDWSLNGSLFYLTDTVRLTIYLYDYDVENGTIHNERNFIQFEKGEYPDGMCMDKEENFWITIWGKGKIKRFNKKGKLIDKILLPVPHPTSCCFGGEKMNLLFVTSSQLELNAAQRKEYPLAGNVFILETDTEGQVQRKYETL